MSLNVIKVDTVRAVPEVLNLRKERYYSCFDGGEDITCYQYNSQGVNNSNNTITCNPPNEKTVIDPIIYQKYNFLLTYSATNNQGINRLILDVADPSKPLEKPICDALRQFPIANITSTCQMNVNGQSFTTNLNDYFNSFIRFSNCKNKQDRFYSTTASQLDESLTYEDIYLTNRSPFAQYGDNPVQGSRASFANFKIITNPVLAAGASGVATVEVEVVEPIFMSPFLFQKRGLTGITTMTYNAVLGDLHRLVCRSPVNGNASNPPLTLSNLNVQVTDVKLLFKYITPKLLDDIPKNLVYSYNDVLPAVNESALTVNAGASSTISMNAVNLQAVPNRLLVYCREINNDINGLANIGKTDAINSLIESVSINYNNSTGKLSSATPQDLYQISRKNGLDMSWSQYSKEIGSVLCIDMGKDIGLSSLECPGLLSNPQLSMNVKFKNISSRNIKFALYVYIVYDGTLTIVDKNLNKQIGVLSSNDVVNTQSKKKVYVDDDRPKNYFGGINIIPILKGIRAAIQTVAPVLKKGADIAENVGLGKKRKKKAGRIAGRIAGGKSVSRKKLMELMKY